MKFRIPGVHEWTPIWKWRPYGAPVFLHWTALLVVLAIVAFALTSPIHGILAVGCYLAVIVVHELGHAFVAHRLGYRVDGNYVTAWHGWCVTTAPEYEWEGVMIAWGGVAAQFAMAVPPLLLMLVLGDRDWGYLTAPLVVLGYLNPVIAIANLLPGEELCDGRTAWRVVPLLVERWRNNRERKAWRERAKRKRT